MVLYTQIPYRKQNFWISEIKVNVTCCHYICYIKKECICLWVITVAMQLCQLCFLQKYAYLYTYRNTDRNQAVMVYIRWPQWSDRLVVDASASGCPASPRWRRLGIGGGPPAPQSINNCQRKGGEDERPGEAYVWKFHPKWSKFGTIVYLVSKTKQI